MPNISATFFFKQLLMLCCAFILIACGSDNAVPTNDSQASSIPTKPVEISSDLLRIYQRSCRNCHEAQATGAPQTGDKASWEKILSKGIYNTLDRVMSGFGGMPPAGQCFECSADQMKSLILYMSHPMNPNSTGK